MTTIIEHYRAFINGGDPHLRQFLLLRSIIPMITVVLLYVLFVTYIGPILMKKRKPMELRKVIIFYNCGLAIYYTYFLLKGAYFLYMFGLPVLCQNTDDMHKNPLVYELFVHGYGMFVVRYFEMIDTLFLVLSKKFKMITKLHVFHHAVVPVFGWFGFRSEKNSYLAAFFAINSFVHVIMYIYYAVSALGPEYQKYLWWKKYLTILQISQFFFVAFYLVFMYFVGCVQSKATAVFGAFLCVLFFFWFIYYYRQAFVDGKKKENQYNGISSSIKDK